MAEPVRVSGMVIRWAYLHERLAETEVKASPARSKIGDGPWFDSSIEVVSQTGFNVNQHMNERGQEGWELVQHVLWNEPQGVIAHILTWKREIPNE